MTWVNYLAIGLCVLQTLLLLRLNAEIEVLRRERDSLLKQIKALLVVYGKPVDKRREHR